MNSVEIAIVISVLAIIVPIIIGFFSSRSRKAEKILAEATAKADKADVIKIIDDELKGRMKPLEDKVKDVKPSSHLKDSVSCLSSDTYDMSAYMEKLLKASGQAMPDTKRILELNISHPVMEKIQLIFEKNNDR